jgi:hypothetical protein
MSAEESYEARVQKAMSKKIADLNVLLDLAEEALGKHSINQTSARETLAVIKSGRKMIEVK